MSNASPSITAPAGFYAAGVACGIKPSGKTDLALIVADRPCSAAGVFTRSRTTAAPVAINRQHLRGGRAQAIIVNAGNANASTGRQGERDAMQMCQLAAEHLQRAAVPELASLTLRPRDVLVSSTGIIGRPMPMDRVAEGAKELPRHLARGKDADDAAAHAIITTDLVTKGAVRRFKQGGKQITLGGICKGSGMIAPNMATMLAFVTTDAAISPRLLREALRDAATASFNRISVDQHTSPSDMILVLASGAAEAPEIAPGSDDEATFREKLTDLCRDLAYQVVKDGEGATKVFRVQVAEARDEREADKIAKAIVDSPLVKTAVHGEDPNWGRITTAAGYSGAMVDPETMSLHIGGKRGVCVYKAGVPTKLTAKQQARVEKVMQQKELTFRLTLGRGDTEVEWLGCDLSRQYITINADYTT
ncbi:MAG: bifunctional glutamate N-acetyltransferase/amino-acid acetyltransferase ArgJ [Phycisphaeraceae bacterium]